MGTQAGDSQMRCCTEVGTSRFPLVKGSIRGMQLFCPKKQKGQKLGGPDPCGVPNHPGSL